MLFTFSKKRVLTILLLFCFIILQSPHNQWTKKYFVFPTIENLNFKYDNTINLAGVLFGIRRIASDIIFIHILQYYGRPEQDIDHWTQHQGGGRYYDLYDLSLTAVRLDPYFYHAYLFSSASLAWNLKRINQAVSLLQEGIKNDPYFWQFHLYLAAIIYKERGEFLKFVEILEKAVKYPQCPNLVKSILGNIYVLTKDYKKALQLWQEILESGDLRYKEIAEEKIKLFKQK